MDKQQINGEVWRDTDGNILHAHGGHILCHGDTYYWYGENRSGNKYVSVYQSKDLQTWQFCRDVLTTNSCTAPHRVRTNTALTTENGRKVNIERPKVLYNEATKQFVMWMHMENGIDYSEAACAIAVCDTPDGAFTYLGSFRPFGYMSRDCTLFQDKDGTAYFISASRDNADLHLYRLSSDYLNVDCLVQKLWQGEYREAPAVLERNGRYYMLSSYCTGWAPNQCCYAAADRMDGQWSILHNIGDATTYRTQPAFVLPVKDQYLYFGDRWNGENYDDSRYVVLPLQFTPEGGLMLTYTDTFALD